MALFRFLCRGDHQRLFWSFFALWPRPGSLTSLQTAAYRVKALPDFAWPKSSNSELRTPPTPRDFRGLILHILHHLHLTMNDPRQPAANDEQLTEDSGDELADLEKEFALRKQRLIEARARRKHREASAPLQVTRSPLPPRERAAPGESNGAKKIDKIERKAPWRRANESAFATRLQQTEAAPQTAQNYHERFFEFENIPKRENVPCDETCDVSGMALSRRHINSAKAGQMLANVKILRVEKLLAKVTAPEFTEPSYTNWAFSGIVVSKLAPKTLATNSRYMVVKIGNFLHSVDVMLFGEAFLKYWKLALGDVVCILNPRVRKFGKSFSLHIQGDLDCVLELGSAKHYGHCSATTKSGTPCKYVVDRLQSELCSFHEEAKFSGGGGGRMELQGLVKSRAPRDRSGALQQMFMSRNSHVPVVVSTYEQTGITERDSVVLHSGGFDETRFDRPVSEKQQEKRRRTVMEAANKKLEQKLASTAPRHHLDLEKLGLLSQKSAPSSDGKLRRVAFRSDFLAGIGFDPTLQGTCRKVSRLDTVQELASLSRHKSASLKPSHEDVARRKHKWKQNLLLAKKSATNASASSTALPSSAAALAPPLPKRSRTYPPRITSADSGVSDSDSDLEIAFSDNSDLVAYMQANGASDPAT